MAQIRKRKYQPGGATEEPEESNNVAAAQRTTSESNIPASQPSDTPTDTPATATNVTTPRRYGRFTYDNHTYDVDDNFIDQLTKYTKTLRPDVGAQLGKVTEALMRGEDVVFNSAGNGSISSNVNFDVSKRQLKRMSRRRTGVGTGFGQLWHGKEQDAREAISALRGFNYVPASPAVRHAHWDKEIKMDYITDEDGTKHYVNSMSNASAINRLNELRNISGYDENTKFYGYGDADKEAYINYYNRLGEEGVAALIDRLEKGTYTKEDVLAAKDIGILIDTETSGNSSPEDVAKRKAESARKALTAAGVPKDLIDSGIVVIGDDGKSISIGNMDPAIFGSRNSIYNNAWQNMLTTKGLWNPAYEWFLGKTRYNGKLYDTNDLGRENSDLYKAARQQGGFYDLNAADRYNDANNIFEYQWGIPEDSSVFDKTQYYSKFFYDNPNIRYRSLNGLYNVGNDKQVIEYWTPDNRDMYGRPGTYKYAILDKDGNVINDNIDINKYTRSENGQQQDLTALRLINNPDSPYNGRYIRTYNDNSGTSNPYELYIDPNDPDNVILYNKTLANKMYGKALRVPREFMAQINKSPNFWTTLIGNKMLQDRFFRTLMEGTGSQGGELWRNIFGPSTLEPENYRALGISEDQIPTLMNIMEHEYGDRNGRSKYARKQEYLVPHYEVPEMQKGGVVSTAAGVEGHDSKKKVKEYHDVSKVAGAHDDWDLSNADKWQIASIAGDVASLIASIPTGGNPLAGAIGYGSSLAQFGADVSRDGFQFGDLGGLLLNLGLDTVTLLPGVGGVSKLAKLGKTVKKSAGILKKLFVGIGAVQGLEGLKNIVSGNATLDDWKKLSMGLLAGKAIGQGVKNIRMTEYRPSGTRVTPKTKAQLKSEYVDKVIGEAKAKNGNDLTKLNGHTVEWANPDGTVKDYAKAYEALKSSGNLSDSKFNEFSRAAQAAFSQVNATAQNIVGNKWNPFSKNFKYNALNRYLPEDFNLQSLNGKTSQLRTIGRLIRTNDNVRAQLQAKNWVLPETLGWNSNHGGNWFYRSPVFTGITTTRRPSQLALPPSSGIRDIPVTLSGRRDPVVITNIDPYIQNIDGYYGMRFHKKGGKIIKAQAGGDYTDELPAAVAVAQKNPAPINIQGKPTPISMLQGAGGNGNDNDDGGQFNFNKLADIASYINSMVTINKNAKLEKDAIRIGMEGSQKSMPTEYYSRFSDNGLHRAYDDRIKSMQNFQSVSADPNTTMSERLMRDMKVDEMKNERDTKFGQMIDQYNNTILAQKQKYAEQRREIADANRQSWAAGMAALKKVDINTALQKAHNNDMMLNQIRGDYNRDIAEKQQAETRKNYALANDAMMKEFANLYETEYNEANKENAYPDLLSYVAAKHPKEFSNIQTKYLVNFDIDQYNRGIPHGLVRSKIAPYMIPYSYSAPPANEIHQYFKKGGSISRLSEEELSRLERQKALYKAVSQLNKDIMELFMKMMS